MLQTTIVLMGKTRKLFKLLKKLIEPRFTNTFESGGVQNIGT